MALRLPARLERATAALFLSLPRPLLRRIVGPAPRSPEGYELDLQDQAILWLMDLVQVPDMHEQPLPDARRSMDRMVPLFDAPSTAAIATHDRFFHGADGPLPTRIYRPAGLRAPSPALVWFHGGGFVVGSIDSHDGTCRALASKAGIVVVSVQYRLAPEHRFPAAPHDAIAAMRSILENAEALGIDSARVAVGGDSAGGNLAAVVAQTLRSDARRPMFQLLVYPATDMTRSEPSHRHFAKGYFLAKPVLDWYLANYLPDEQSQKNPLASPLLAPDVSGVPSALVITAGFDPLRDEGQRYADKMRAAGVSVEHVCAEGSMHGFFSMSGVFDEGARLVDLAAARLRAALSPRE